MTDPTSQLGYEEFHVYGRRGAEFGHGIIAMYPDRVETRWYQRWGVCS